MEGEKMLSKTTILGLTFIAGCGLAGCSHGSSSSGTANKSGATELASRTAPAGISCAALTAAKASEVLHASITLTVDTSAGDGESNCTYTYSTGGVARAYVVVGPKAEQAYEAMKNGVTEPSDVAGVGDKAFDSGQGFCAIQRDHYVAVIGTTPGDETGKRRLAEAMLAAL
jgi:hypothetical protein